MELVNWVVSCNRYLFLILNTIVTKYADTYTCSSSIYLNIEITFAISLEAFIIINSLHI